MKTVTISLEDEVYASVEQEAARRQKSLGEFLRELLQGFRAKKTATTTLESLWGLADAKPVMEGTVGRLNREEIYDRGFSRH